MRPIVNGLQAEFEDQISFDAIDAASDSGALALKAYRLRGHPSYVIVDEDGNPLWSFSGQADEEILREQIEQKLN